MPTADRGQIPGVKTTIQQKAAPPAKAAAERLLVAFDYSGKGHIVFCQGLYIEPEAREHADIEYHSIDYPEPAPEPGSIHVYEAIPYEHDGVWFHNRGKWREAKLVMEKASVATCAYLGIWPDIPTGPEYMKEVRKNVKTEPVEVK